MHFHYISSNVIYLNLSRHSVKWLQITWAIPQEKNHTQLENSYINTKLYGHQLYKIAVKIEELLKTTNLTPIMFKSHSIIKSKVLKPH